LNYLAHFYLAFPNQGLVTGNFIADDVKGNKFLSFPGPIKKGILMHRFIDSYTDSHAYCLQAKSMLYQYFHKYAGVVLDVYFDHFLAIKWLQYSNISLHEFCQQIESILKLDEHHFSDKMKNIFYWMKLHNWLLRYSTIEGIEKSLEGMSRRTPFRSGMEQGGEVLIKHYIFLEDVFDKYFPVLLATIKDSGEFD
jgi:acyl carrier protein phosphodiesterase